MGWFFIISAIIFLLVYLEDLAWIYLNTRRQKRLAEILAEQEQEFMVTTDDPVGLEDILDRKDEPFTTKSGTVIDFKQIAHDILEKQRNKGE